MPATTCVSEGQTLLIGDEPWFAVSRNPSGEWVATPLLDRVADLSADEADAFADAGRVAAYEVRRRRDDDARADAA